MSDKEVKNKKNTPEDIVSIDNKDTDLKSQFTSVIEKSHSFISKYILLFTVTVSSLTIIIALLISQHYINPVRDEQVYNEGEAQISFKEINQDKLKTLQESLETSNVEVGTDFVPDRTNPFAE